MELKSNKPFCIFVNIKTFNRTAYGIEIQNLRRLLFEQSGF